MQYRIISCHGDNLGSVLKEIEKEVEKLCKEGWKLQGGISVAVESCGWFHVCQAMVK